MSMVFYLASVMLSLYAAYLFTFKTYGTDDKGQPTKRMVCQNVIYLLVWLLTILPIVNVILVVFAAIAGAINTFFNDIYIDSWLFRQPKEKDNNNKED